MADEGWRIRIGPSSVIQHPSSRSYNQHRIAITIETVPLAYGLRVRRENPLAAGERGDEHQQRRPGQMEIGHQRADDLKAEPGVDEHTGALASGRHSAAAARRR